MKVRKKSRKDVVKIKTALDLILLKRILKTIKKTKVLNEHKVRWLLEDNEPWGSALRARCNRREFCPITFYCFVKTGVYFRIDQTDRAVVHCDIPNDIHGEINDAADDVGDPELRQRLLQTTGLA